MHFINQSNIVKSNSTVNGLFSIHRLVYNEGFPILFKSLIVFALMIIDWANVVVNISTINWLIAVYGFIHRKWSAKVLQCFSKFGLFFIGTAYIIEGTGTVNWYFTVLFIDFQCSDIILMSFIIFRQLSINISNVL